MFLGLQFLNKSPETTRKKIQILLYFPVSTTLLLLLLLQHYNTTFGNIIGILLIMSHLYTMQNFMDRMNQLFTVINQIGTTVDGISLELKQIQSKMERLEETNDRNNLRLLDRINNVESTLLEIKESNSSIASRYPSGSIGSSNNHNNIASTAEVFTFEDFRVKYFTRTIVEDFSGPVTKQFCSFMR